MEGGSTVQNRGRNGYQAEGMQAVRRYNKHVNFFIFLGGEGGGKGGAGCLIFFILISGFLAIFRQILGQLRWN